jgi:hypothetical protein
MLTRKKKKQLMLMKDISLMAAMFFLPFGYDFLFKWIMDVTGSYWTADITFYTISGIFWIIFVIVSKILKNN